MASGGNSSEAGRIAGSDTLSHPGALATLTRLRWLSIAGQALAIGLVPWLLPLHLPWLPMAGGVALLFAFNLWVVVRVRRGTGGPVLLHLGVDIAVLAWQLYWSGGPANPFVSLFVVPIALATALLPARSVVATALMAVLAYGLLWWQHKPLPHVHGEFDLHLLGMWLNFLLTAAVLGGIGSIPGAMIGGLILGVAEALSSAYLSTEYKDVVSFALLIVVLLVMPTGILGRPEVEKV